MVVKGCQFDLSFKRNVALLRIAKCAILDNTQFVSQCQGTLEEPLVVCGYAVDISSIAWIEPSPR